MRGHIIYILRKTKNEVLDIAFKTLCRVTFSMLVYKCKKNCLDKSSRETVAM